MDEKSSAPLVLRDFGGKIEITPDAWSIREQALDAAKPISRVTTPEEQATAVEALRKLKAIRNGMEATRKAIKAPVLDLGKQIDSTAAGFLEQVTKQEGRLQGMINHYQKKQLEAKREEDERIAREATKAVDLEAEAQRLRHEAVFCEDKAKAQAMLQEAAQYEKDAVDRKLTAELILTSPEIAKSKGLVVRNRINFEVTDAIAFCQGYPHFWKWHKETETLKLDRMLLLDELNREGGGLFHRTRFPEELSASEDRRLVRPPGLRVFEETKSHVR